LERDNRVVRWWDCGEMNSVPVEEEKALGDGARLPRNEEGGGEVVVGANDVYKRVSDLEPVVSLSGVADYNNALACSKDRVVVIKFYAPWCRSCKAMEPKVKRLAREFPQMLFCELDFQQNQDLCRDIGVKSIPAFHFYHSDNGRVEDFTAGPARAAILRQKVEKYSTTTQGNSL